MPADFEKALGLGLASLKSGDFPEALRQFDEATRQGGGARARALREKVRGLLARLPGATAENPYSSLQQEFIEALERADYPAAVQLAERYLDKDPVGAFRALRDCWLQTSMSVVDPATPPAWRSFFLAVAAWNKDHDAEAIEYLEQAAKGPGMVWVRYFIAEVQLRWQKRPTLALAQLDGVIAGAPWLWEARCLRQEVLIGLGRGAQSLRELKTLVVEHATSAGPFLAWRGALYGLAGEYPAAFADLDKAAAAGNHDAFCWRGAARLAHGDLEGAETDLSRLLAADPTDPEGLVCYGEVLRRRGHLDEAQAALDQASKLSGKEMNPWAYINRCLLNLALGHEERACRDFLASAAIGLDQPATATQLAAVQVAQIPELLATSFTAAHSCRRLDHHLNRGWMLVAGLEFSEDADEETLFAAWYTHLGMPLSS
jgi:tetratricopeptide (TPR) repeat protein